MPDLYIAEFFDGPLEGCCFSLAECPDKLLIIFKGNHRVRYETDQVDATRIGENDVDVCRMVVSRDAESFDAEVGEP
jgi:hypothetical protein